MNILDKYISKLPPYAFEHDTFYLRPLQVVPANLNAPWYAFVPVGRDTLQKKFHLMCERAGIKGSKTNHSLRTTGVTTIREWSSREAHSRVYRSLLIRGPSCVRTNKCSAA